MYPKYPKSFPAMSPFHRFARAKSCHRPQLPFQSSLPHMNVAPVAIWFALFRPIKRSRFVPNFCYFGEGQQCTGVLKGWRDMPRQPERLSGRTAATWGSRRTFPKFLYRFNIFQDWGNMAKLWGLPGTSRVATASCKGSWGDMGNFEFRCVGPSALP